MVMNFFEINGSELLWRNHGETLSILPWGPDSLRVRSILMGELRDDRFALLDPVPCPDTETVITDEASTPSTAVAAKCSLSLFRRWVRSERSIK